MRVFILTYLAVLIAATEFTVKSPAFAYGNYIPEKYTCTGENVNPMLFAEGVPENSKSLALIMTDTSAAFGVFDHWIVWNIPVKGKIEENSTPGVVGLNGHNENKYTGPCPPNGIHEYHFKLFALDKLLELPANTDKQALLNAMQGHVLGQAELVGLYQK
jgi:Raf kinase inhibitor-like YbhB/YbcL family protein